MKAVSSLEGVWETADTYKKIRLAHFSYTIHKNKLKTEEDLNIRPQTIKLLEENIGSECSDIFLRNIFSDISP